MDIAYVYGNDDSIEVLNASLVVSPYLFHTCTNTPP